ncbi:hypothetical protein CI109_105460 [Kwoniella shandongensis]|uniref:Uncharacterized protein n=1 Tax=Kwoniella shandongensis TaxID=1734106 RepID=A0A5M6C7V6_9TREE|nr:uncharacterized protein CI109_002181 [Kwoniella shandongensis]KAA5529289.1 hypothetical protein CI109_002181 [Kwoniella shandongensis]
MILSDGKLIRLVPGHARLAHPDSVEEDEDGVLANREGYDLRQLELLCAADSEIQSAIHRLVRDKVRGQARLLGETERCGDSASASTSLEGGDDTHDMSGSRWTRDPTSLPSNNVQPTTGLSDRGDTDWGRSSIPTSSFATSPSQGDDPPPPYTSHVEFNIPEYGVQSYSCHDHGREERGNSNDYWLRRGGRIGRRRRSEAWSGPRPESGIWTSHRSTDILSVFATGPSIDPTLHSTSSFHSDSRASSNSATSLATSTSTSTSTTSSEFAETSFFSRAL